MTHDASNLKGSQAATAQPTAGSSTSEPEGDHAAASPQDAAALARELSTAPLPTLVVPLAASSVVETFDKLARRGKLAGFTPIDPARTDKATAGSLFSIAAFGSPFDAVLFARIQISKRDASQPPSTRLVFSRSLKTKGLYLFGLVLLLTIWPGIELTRSLLASTFPEQRWLIDTLPYWYLPLTIISLPWGLWEAWRRSDRSSHLAAHIAITKLAEDIPGATLES